MKDVLVRALLKLQTGREPTAFAEVAAHAAPKGAEKLEKQLEQVLSQLTESDRNVVVLAMRGYNLEAIACMVGMPGRQSIRASICRAYLLAERLPDRKLEIAVPT